MSNIRLFFSNTLSKNMIDKLDKSQSHYLTKVMRLKKNDTFSLFNKTGEWEAKILDITKDFVEFKSCLLYTSPSPRDRSLSRMPSSA